MFLDILSVLYEYVLHQSRTLVLDATAPLHPSGKARSSPRGMFLHKDGAVREWTSVATTWKFGGAGPLYLRGWGKMWVPYKVAS